MKYKLTVSDRDYKIYDREGRFVRTPTTLYFDIKDKLYWEMQLLKKGITGYTLEYLEDEPKQSKPAPRITVTKQPVRPSNQRRG